MTKKQKHVSIYARVSTNKQTVDMQIRELRNFVKRSGWEIHREFIDQGYTGTSTDMPAESHIYTCGVDST